MFCVYSGTGNSYRVAAWMAEEACAAGWSASVHLIAQSSERSYLRQVAVDADLVVLAAPTHGFTAPHGALRFAWQLPPGQGRTAAVAVTRGSMRIGSRPGRRVYVPGWEGNAALLLACILWLKGYRVLGFVGVDMPASWLSVHPGLPDDAVAHISSRARARAEIEMRRWLCGQGSRVPWLTVLLGLAVLPGSLTYMVMGRRMLGMLFFASDVCTGCGLCAAACPHGAIQMVSRDGESPRPVWTRRCESCMRCMAYCPVQAIEAQQALGIGLMALAGAAPDLRGNGPLRRVPKWVVDCLVGLALVEFVRPLVQRLLRTPVLNRLATSTTLTRRYRRYHEPDTPLALLMS